MGILRLFPSAAARDLVVKEYGAIEGGTQTPEALAEHLPTMTAAPAEQAFVVTRVFNAPRELVFKAWTEPGRLRHWWGPNGFTMRVAKLDLRPGGVFHYGMRAPNGQDMWGKFVYREIVPPERLAFVVSFSDENGNTVRAPFSATWPLEVLSTVTLTERDGKTTLTMQGVPVNATEIERKTFADGDTGMQQGWAGTLDQLAAHLATTWKYRMAAFGRGWLNHPWKAFWATMLAYVVGVSLFGFFDSPLYSPTLAADFLYAVVISLVTSFTRGLWVSWRASKIGALVKVGMPIAICAVIVAIAISLMRDVERKARLAGDEGSLIALRTAIAAYTREHGRLPPDKAAVEALVTPNPPWWQCPGQNWVYNPTTGDARLVITDLRACR